MSIFALAIHPWTTGSPTTIGGLMLSVSTYSPEHVAASRARVASQIAAYRELAKTAHDRAEPDDAALDAAFAAFEPVFYNNMVLTLDSCFTHRARTQEGKDGNPLNEVRVLCNSLLQNGGVLTADRSINLKPATSVLGYEVGDEINVTEAAFVRLSEAFFAELETRFVQEG
jgi:hypothetical protein